MAGCVIVTARFQPDSFVLNLITVGYPTIHSSGALLVLDVGTPANLVRCVGLVVILHTACSWVESILNSLCTHHDAASHCSLLLMVMSPSVLCITYIRQPKDAIEC